MGRGAWSNGKPLSGKVGIAELIAFVDGLADDAEAVVNGCSMTWSNGMVEGFINKVKWIKRSSYGQAGFPLLQRRVLLHPAQKAPTGRHPEDKQDTSACSLSRAEEASTTAQLIA